MDQTDNLIEAYDEIYTSQGILHRDSFYLWLINLLNPVLGRNLLDISCGQGRLVSLAHQMGLNAIGIDFSMDGLKAGYLDLPLAVWSVGDGESLPVQDESFEYITHVGSLEHYLHPELGAKEIMFGKLVTCLMMANLCNVMEPMDFGNPCLQTMD
jgi:ubiquinone/menaquinone biosynthesis C-methylase UbiE